MESVFKSSHTRTTKLRQFYEYVLQTFKKWAGEGGLEAGGQKIQFHF